MHRGSLVVFLVGVAVVGALPLVMLVAYAIRRRSEAGAPVSPRATALRVSLAVLAVAALGGAAYLTVSPSRGATHEAHDSMPASRTLRLPPRLAGQSMTDEVTGADAIDAVSALHGTSFPIESAAVAGYGDGAIRVWASSTSDEAMAAEMTQRMASRIAEGGSPFAEPRPLAGYPGVWTTRGMGQVHYFFASGSVVWWLAADPADAERALEQLTEVKG